MTQLERQRLKVDAVQAVAKAVHNGDLPPASSLVCDDCGGFASDYDHRDYRQPLNVVPTCRSCNLKRGPDETASLVETEPDSKVFDRCTCPRKECKHEWISRVEKPVACPRCHYRLDALPSKRKPAKKNKPAER